MEVQRNEVTYSESHRDLLNYPFPQLLHIKCDNACKVQCLAHSKYLIPCGSYCYKIRYDTSDSLYS